MTITTVWIFFRKVHICSNVLQYNTSEKKVNYYLRLTFVAHTRHARQLISFRAMQYGKYFICSIFCSFLYLKFDQIFATNDKKLKTARLTCNKIHLEKNVNNKNSAI